MAVQERVLFMQDGTNIEYTISGVGPAILLIHGSQLTDVLAESLVEMLANKFTVYFMYRRGWGNSGAKGSDYSMQKECKDAIELLSAYNIKYVLGEEYGAVIVLHLALRHPLEKIILLEPFLTSHRNLRWIPKLNRQIAKGDYLGAMVTYVKGSNYRAKYFPGLFLKLMFKHSSFSIDRDKQIIAEILECGDPEQSTWLKKDIESEDWKHHKRMLRTLSTEICAAQQSESEFTGLHSLASKVLFCCDIDSEPYVYKSVEALSSVIPGSNKIVVELYSNEKKRSGSPARPNFLQVVTLFLKGKIISENGDIYEGDFKEGKRHGKGKMTLANGDIYEGDFKEGRPHGKGKITLANGTIYEGYCKEGKLDGKGKMTWANGDIYEGDYKEGSPNGKGKMTRANGDIFEGDFKEGNLDGKGKTTLANGDIYEGDYKEGKK